MMKMTTQSRATRAGFTLIEVMMALAVMSVGAVGIMSLQQASTRGNVESREVGTATMVTRRWVERLKIDALAWNSPGTTADVLGNTKYLQLVDGAWHAPVDEDGIDSFAANFFGEDVMDDAVGMGAQHFCTHVRLRWTAAGDTIRADVRTFWFRRGSDNSLFENCASGAEAIVDGDLMSPTSVLRSVQTSTLIRWNQIANGGAIGGDTEFEGDDDIGDPIDDDFPGDDTLPGDDDIFPPGPGPDIFF